MSCSLTSLADGGFSLSTDRSHMRHSDDGMSSVSLRGMSHLHSSLKTSIRKRQKSRKQLSSITLMRFFGQKLWSLHQDWEASWFEDLSTPSEKNLRLLSAAADSFLWGFYSEILCSQAGIWLELKPSFPLEFYCFYKILLLVINLEDVESCFNTGQWKCFHYFISFQGQGCFLVWCDSFKINVVDGGLAWIPKFKVSLQSRFQVSLVYLGK